jgi:site-specific DNA-adenine methylase
MEKKKKEAVLIGRLGNKDNDIKHFCNLLPSDIKNFVEPFGGSYSLCRNIYYDDKYNKYVNDTDSDLYYIYENIDLWAKERDRFNKLALKHYDEDKKFVNFKKFKEEFDKDFTNEIIKRSLEKIFIIRGGLVKTIKNNLNFDDQIKFHNKINFSNKDWKEIMEKFYKDKNAFIFLDPPYLFSDNSSYQEQREQKDNTDMPILILDYFKNKKTKCKIMLVVNDIKYIRMLFKDYIKCEYDKIYQIGKRKEKHLVICNY